MALRARLIKDAAGPNVNADGKAKLGTSIAKAIRAFSDSLRTKRRQRALQAAQRASVKLLFPLACFLFPTLFTAILGPAILQLMDTFAKT